MVQKSKDFAQQKFEFPKPKHGLVAKLDTLTLAWGAVQPPAPPPPAAPLLKEKRIGIIDLLCDLPVSIGAIDARVWRWSICHVYRVGWWLQNVCFPYHLNDQQSCNVLHNLTPFYMYHLQSTSLLLPAKVDHKPIQRIWAYHVREDMSWRDPAPITSRVSWIGRRWGCIPACANSVFSCSI